MHNVVMERIGRCIKRVWLRSPLLFAVLVTAIISMIIYRLIDGWKPKEMLYDQPYLDYADLTGDRTTELWKDDEFECLGWRATHGCDPHGPRDHSRDRGCDESLTRVSGYCEIRNRTSGEVMHVMLSTCKTWRWWKVDGIVTCNGARHFTDFSIIAAEYTHKEPLALPTDGQWDRGITIVVYPKVVAGLYAIVRLLRQLGCTLPVEIWIDPTEMKASHSILVELTTKHNAFVRTIEDPLAKDFLTKPYALYHSRFENVLLLDCDNLPVKDPTYLFDSPEFQKHGAMFWPDFWRPAVSTPFNVHSQSALWQLLDMPFTNMFEQESGQVLVNRKRSQRALNKLMFYAGHEPRLLTDWALVMGDKDLFRLAWLNTTTPFYYVPHLLALGGIYEEASSFFCGVSMLQRDPAGDVVFVHRNQAKLAGKKDQVGYVKYMQTFAGGDGDATSLKHDLDKYRVQCKMRRLNMFTCFQLKPLTIQGEVTPVAVDSLNDTNIPQLELDAIKLSIEGRALLTAEEEKEVASIDEEEMTRRAKRVAELKAEDQAEAVKFYSIVAVAVIPIVVAIGLWLAYRKRDDAVTKVVDEKDEATHVKTRASTVRSRVSRDSSLV